MWGMRLRACLCSALGDLLGSCFTWTQYSLLKQNTKRKSSLQIKKLTSYGTHSTPTSKQSTAHSETFAVSVTEDPTTLRIRIPLDKYCKNCEVMLVHKKENLCLDCLILRNRNRGYKSWFKLW